MGKLGRMNLEFLDHVLDMPSVIERMFYEKKPEIGLFRCRMYRDDTEIEQVPQQSLRLRIYFLHVLDTTFGNGPVQESQLLDTDDTLIRNNEKIELVVDEIDIHEQEHHGPIDRHERPKNGRRQQGEYRIPIRDKRYRGSDKQERRHENTDEYDPMPLEHELDRLSFAKILKRCLKGVHSTTIK